MTPKNMFPTVSFDTWKKSVDEQLTRLSAMHKEIERYEAQGQDQAKAAIDELSRLMKDSLTYSSQIAAGWRQASMEYTQRAADMYRNVSASFVPPANA